jgi:hypothetical protein
MSALAGRVARRMNVPKTAIATILAALIVNSSFVMVFILVFIVFPFQVSAETSNRRPVCCGLIRKKTSELGKSAQLPPVFLKKRGVQLDDASCTPFESCEPGY